MNSQNLRDRQIGKNHQENTIYIYTHTYIIKEPGGKAGGVLPSDVFAVQQRYSPACSKATLERRGGAKKPKTQTRLKSYLNQWFLSFVGLFGGFFLHLKF